MNIIELCGIPGSGKTTFINEIESVLSSNVNFLSSNVAKRTALRKHFFSEKSFLRYIPDPIFSKFSNRLYRYYSIENIYFEKFVHLNNKLVTTFSDINDLITKDDIFKQLINTWFIQSTSLYSLYKLNLKHNTMTIMQEGLIHKVMNLFVGVDLQFDEDNISSYLSELPIIEHLIYMDISAEKAIERIGSRHTRSRNLSLQSKKDFFKLANKVYSFVLDFLSHKGTKIHIIDNTSNKDKALKSLKTSLNTLIN